MAELNSTIVRGNLRVTSDVDVSGGTLRMPLSTNIGGSTATGLVKYTNGVLSIDTTGYGTGTITGVSVNGTSIATSGVANIPAASATATGVVTTGDQTFAGTKTIYSTGIGLKIKRNNSSAGALIDFYNNNQDTNYWRMGMINTDNAFNFQYNGTELINMATNGCTTIKGSNYNILTVKRTTANTGAFIDYQAANQTVKSWLAGMANNDTFLFQYSSNSGSTWTSVASIDTSGNIYEGSTKLSEKYQGLDADLTAIAGLTGTSGLLKKTAANTWSLDTITYQAQVAKLGSTTKPLYTSAAGTFAECSTYAGGTAVTLNGTSKAANTASFYAPTSAGTANQLLISGGSNTAPSWLSTGTGYVTITDGVVGVDSNTYYLASNPSGYTSNTGTVTSVRVQATSPVQSSTSTAQSTSLNTTISLASGYGDTQNPYGTKTANYVLAGPSSGSAAVPSFRALVVGDLPTGTTSSTVALGNHTHTTSIAAASSSATVQLSMDANTMYTLTAGGTSFVFNTPTDTWRPVGTGATDAAAGNHVHGNLTNGGLLGTASRVAITDGSKYLTTSSVTTTELGYLSGVTSNIQTQLGGRIIYNDVLMPTNPFGGKSLYINSVDNAFASADKKYYVTITKHSTSSGGTTYPYIDTSKAVTDDGYFVDGPVVSTLTTSARDLFNGSYEDTNISCASGQYLKIRIMFGSNTSPSGSTSYFPGYPYGTYYLSYYHVSSPTQASQCRVYNKYASQTTGWKLYTASVYAGSRGGVCIESIEDSSDYQRTCVEFIIYGKSGNVNPTEIDYKLVRPNLSNDGATVTKYGAQSLYHTFRWYNGSHTEVAKIDASGGIYGQTLYENGTALSDKYYLATNPSGYTSNAGTITGVSVNGTSVATSGIANITSVPWSIISSKPTIPATNVIPATTTANKVLLSTTTSGTAAWSAWSTAGLLTTNTSGAVSSSNTLSMAAAGSSATTQIGLNADTMYTLSVGNLSYVFTTPADTWRPLGSTATTAAAGNHTHTLSIAADSGTSALDMAANTKYKITAGGSTFIFKTPAAGGGGGGNAALFGCGLVASTANDVSTSWTAPSPYTGGLNNNRFNYSSMPILGNITINALTAGNTNYLYDWVFKFYALSGGTTTFSGLQVYWATDNTMPEGSMCILRVSYDACWGAYVASLQCVTVS